MFYNESLQSTCATIVVSRDGPLVRLSIVLFLRGPTAIVQAKKTSICHFHYFQNSKKEKILLQKRRMKEVVEEMCTGKMNSSLLESEEHFKVLKL